MKYGAELQDNIFGPWRSSYVAYDALKKELKSRTQNRIWTDLDEYEFVCLLDNEHMKVHDFINAKLSEIDTRILYCERTIQSLQNSETMNSDASYTLMDETLTEILFDVNDLSRFTRVNFLAIQKILKKHDRWTLLNLRQEYVLKLREKPLDKQKFDVAIVYISALHDICRNRGKKHTGNSAAGGDQNAFERATAKYWIHPDNITEVKAIVMLHLPVLVFNTAKKWEPEDSAVSSVYFDNHNLDLYTGRLQRDEMAEAIRFRWYGPFESKNAFVERKTHHATWLNGASVKDRFRVNENRVNEFVSGAYTAEQIAQDFRATGADEAAVKDVHFIADGVQTSFREKQLEPMLRVFYNRTAFQLPGDQKLRISLDTDLTFIREDHTDGIHRRQNPPNNWRRTDVRTDYPFNHVKDSDILRFPYAVLETKLQTHLGQEPPTWLTKLIESHLVHEVPRFSKYLQGASHFYREKLPLLPWWLTEIDVDIRRARSENTGLTRSQSFKPLIDGKYRRAMIEEKERAKKAAESQTVYHIQDNTVANTYTNMNNAGGADKAIQDAQRRRSLVVDDKQELAWKPVYNNANSQDTQYTNLRPDSKRQGSSSQNSATNQPLLDNDPLGGQLQSSKKQADQFYSPGKKTTASSSTVTNLGSGLSGSTANLTKEKKQKQGLGVPVAFDEEAQVGEKKKKSKKLKLEPKTFFANERTFIAWLQFCALLLSVALSLLNLGSDETARIMGGVFIGLAIVVALYALYLFEKRAWMINNHSEGRYDDIWGPAVLCILLVVALIINFYLRFR
ncbi:VTC domain-containing protein [Phycomyces blakesleeanus]|uniref:VTC domain-containing protein n=1 Tax=Phycomyces blakesleeanus TaxID=4837 RepID=A0ABR3B7W2_PHYBL